jgi:hypothetical protein
MSQALTLTLALALTGGIVYLCVRLCRQHRGSEPQRRLFGATLLGLAAVVAGWAVGGSRSRAARQ